MNDRAQTGINGPSAAAELVTVVIPSYNHREYVGAAIESVLTQTYPAIQLIVVDDGSTDGSRDLLEALAAQHGFDLLVQSNSGICRTLNRGIRERARGKYIALLGSDDAWAPDKIAAQIARLREEPGSEFCFTQALTFQQTPARPSGAPFPARPREGRLIGRVVFRQHVPAGTMLFTRALYDSLGGFDEQFKEEDWDFVIRAATRTRFVAVRRPLLFYRTHATNTMRVRPRQEIFHQKILVLAKNFPVLPAGRWLFAVVVHFAHDMLLEYFRRALSRHGAPNANQ
jgi:alpha-1,3-rhamnosyltransferase